MQLYVLNCAEVTVISVAHPFDAPYILPFPAPRVQKNCYFSMPWLYITASIDGSCHASNTWHCQTWPSSYTALDCSSCSRPDRRGRAYIELAAEAPVRHVCENEVCVLTAGCVHAWLRAASLPSVEFMKTTTTKNSWPTQRFVFDGIKNCASHLSSQAAWHGFWPC